MSKEKGLSQADVSALVSSSNKIASSSFNWNSKIQSVDSVVKKLKSISSEHDGCLDSGIQSTSKLSGKLTEMKKEGGVIATGVASAIANYTAAENGNIANPNYNYNNYDIGDGYSGGGGSTSSGGSIDTTDDTPDGTYSGPGNKAVVELAQKQLKSSNKSRIGGGKYWKLFYSGTVNWCACFVSWCMKKNGVSQKIVKRSAAVSAIYQQSLSQGTFHSAHGKYKPKPGDLIVWKSNGRSHIGIVESYKNGKITTIEGNTDSNNMYRSRVARHTFTKAGGYGGATGFISPKYKTKK